jgi:hypothetical protein
MRRLFTRPAPDRRAVELEQQLLNEQPAFNSNTVSARDPTSSLGRSRNALNQGGFLVFGRVVDSIAYIRLYKVQCERGLGTLRCCDSAATGLGVVGARQLNTYPVGTGVLLFYHPQALTHVIICSVPDWMVSAKDALSDYIGQGSNVGLNADAAHYFPFTMPDVGIIDFSAGRPTDSLQAGDWGAISELALRAFLDSFQVQLAVDEMTGFFASYFDQYTRITGLNLDIWSSGYCREDRDDESEFSSVEEYALYPWEAMGLVDPSGVAFEEQTAADCQQDAQNRARFEPVSDRQLGIYRDRCFRGYLGQGSKSQIIVPADLPDPHTYDSDALSVSGLLEENRLIDGTFGLRTARGAYFVKSPLIPAPKRGQRPESQTGDRTDDDYASNGQFGDGDLHKVQSAPAGGGDDIHLIEPSVVLDLMAHAFNWKSLHPFHYHTKDWYVAEESELEAADLMEVPPFADLDQQTFLPQAQKYSVKVDDRYGMVEYYANLSFFAMLPNGGFAQVDGWGAEQRSSGGTQYLHVPGDIVMTAGRNIVLQAGGDVILKGYNNVDASASLGSVRVKAHDNVMIMGGNGGCGGVLIESKSNTPVFKLGEDGEEDAIGGVMLKARNSVVVAVAKQLYLSTAAWEGDEPGAIVIDAGETADIVTRSNQFRRHLISGALDAFGADGDVVNEYWATTTRISTQLVVDGPTYFWGQVTANSDAVFGGIVTATEYCYLSAEQQDTLDSIGETIDGRDISTEIEDSLALVTWLPDNSDLAEMEFYFRAELSLRTTDFTIYEPFWAQIARLNDVALETWQEDVVTGDSHDDSSPYPGLDIWRDQDSYGLQDLNLFDPAGMQAVDRGADYEDPTFADTEWVTLEGNWPITTIST